MLNKQMLDPKSIVVVGGSNDVRKPGGKIVKNLVSGNFKGEIHIVNPKDTKIQRLKSYPSVKVIPSSDLAILAIPAKYCLDAITSLIEEKHTKAFIIISAGFAEAGAKGKEIERQIVSKIESINGCLIGPNCIGVINHNFKGVFTTPIPKFYSDGCDLISGSGATAVFLMEAGMLLGVKFANVYSVGNGAQTGVEDILEYMDLNYEHQTDPPIKLLYIETISNSKKLLKHVASLASKGARIAAIKAGSTLVGSRAATSHTGAIASSDITVRALFKKAGIVYCISREELLSVASIFNYKELKGKNIAIITHAGGSAVMLADELSKGKMGVPQIKGPYAKKLLSFLNPGSSINNPIDFLATGTADQLEIIIDYCEHKFDFIDGMIVVFGSPGLFDVENVYNLLSIKFDECKKPIFPVLPSVVNAHKEINGFLKKGNINFPDEVVLGKALAQVFKTPKPIITNIELPQIDRKVIRQIINQSNNGYLGLLETAKLIDAAGIPGVYQFFESDKEKFLSKLEKKLFPIVMKVIGLIHKTDVKGVILNITSLKKAAKSFDELMKIKDARGVIAQPMIQGLELFIGVNKEEGFNPTIVCGLGGVFVEILKDISAGLSPLSKVEIGKMISSLRGYQMLKGTRGKKGVNIETFIDIIHKVSALVEVAPEIIEMDMNPLIGTEREFKAVDVRIRIAH